MRLTSPTPLIDAVIASVDPPQFSVSPIHVRFGRSPQSARKVFAFTEALAIWGVPVTVSYSVLFIRPPVDSPGKVDMAKTSGGIVSMLNAVRLTEGSGQVEFDGTDIVDVALYASNPMIVGDATCRMKIQVRYEKTKSVAPVDAEIFLCFHNMAMAAPSPAQAPETSWMAVSFCWRERESDTASRWVMKTNNVVYS